MHVAYALQKLFKEELNWLQKMDIIIPLGVVKIVEWCNSFVLVTEVNGKVRLCGDPVRLNHLCRSYAKQHIAKTQQCVIHVNNGCEFRLPQFKVG